MGRWDSDREEQVPCAIMTPAHAGQGPLAKYEIVKNITGRMHIGKISTQSHFEADPAKQLSIENI